MTELSREIVFWAAAAACAVAEGAILFSGLRASGARGGARAAALERLWALLPAIALAWVLAATWTAMHRQAGHERMNMPGMSSSG